MIINGQPATQLDLTDRSIQYGDGCFTTIATSNGKVVHWDLHLRRLQRSVQRLFIDFEKWQELKHNVDKLAQSNDKCVIKIILTRGSGGRGYGVNGVSHSNYILTVHQMPTHYADWQTSGISLGLSPIQLSKQPLLAGIKHLNRLEQVLIKRDLEQKQFDDAIVCDTDGMVVESSVANVFWRKGNSWFTPDLYYSGVEGVMRNLVLAYFDSKRLPVDKVRANLETFKQADEIFICNSLMGIVPVKSFHYQDECEPQFYPITSSIELQQHLSIN